MTLAQYLLQLEQELVAAGEEAESLSFVYRALNKLSFTDFVLKLRAEVSQKDRDQLKAIQEQILKNNKRISVAENVIDKTKTIISAHSKKHNLSGIEVIAIGNLSKGKYWRNYKEIKKITSEIKNDEKTLSNMGIVSFGKGVLKKGRHALFHYEVVKIN